MRKSILLTVLCLCIGNYTFAADEAEASHVKQMKETGATMKSLNGALQAKNSEAAEADAKKLEGLFDSVHTFWQQKKVDDAATHSKTAQDAFGSIAKLAKEGKFEEASAELKRAQGACGGCHKSHREKAEDGSWKFKY